jgi:hypothetical protein
MKGLWMIIVLFVLGASVANATSSYTVLLQASKQPYICVSCSLRTPYPDKKTIDTINAWKDGKAPFSGSSNHQETAHSLSSGDTVAICNGCGCATYTLLAEGLWGEGTFKAVQIHPTVTPSTPSKNGAIPSKVAG